MKRILILTAGFGEGHNAAARGLRGGLALVAPTEVEVSVHDVCAEAYGALNNWTRKSYLGVINHAPDLWSGFYRWLDRKKTFSANFQMLHRLRNRLAQLLRDVQPDVIVSVFPAYPHLLDQILGPATGSGPCQRVVVVTDSITVNAIWYQCSTDFFIVANDESAAILRLAGVEPGKIKVFGFPVDPRFAQGSYAPDPTETSRRVLHMMNVGKASAVELTRRLVEMSDISLTVTVGRNTKLRSAIELLRNQPGRKVEILGWCDDLPRLLQSNHVLVGKAGGATVQEAIAAGCPLIINQVVPGQEEGNAQLVVQTGSGIVATTPDEVVAQLRRIFSDKAQVWREMATQIRRLSRPKASLAIAEFLLSL